MKLENGNGDCLECVLVLQLLKATFLLPLLLSEQQDDEPQSGLRPSVTELCMTAK